MSRLYLSNPCALFLFCTRCCGRSRRPAFPAPSDQERDDELQDSGRSCRENEHLCFHVIASEATLLRLLRKLRRAGSPPKRLARRRKQSSFLRSEKKAGLL